MTQRKCLCLNHRRRKKTKGSEERANLTEKITQEIPQGLRFDKAKKKIGNRSREAYEEKE
ncbi:hypothetical protein JL09_g6930 [Pichia kudriavzevii]|uniref:Uncharacterized protein n=1 Tax=Pichia kudriavzevii TaxID=4909 RepID=A0A099NIE9_PICKU|nr:hypothetical protein JL09_g6930 [Pichia kudriavzevii]